MTRHTPSPMPRPFETVVRVAFSRRRKTLRNALMPLIPENRIAAVGIDPRLRPEQLGVSDYIQLSQLL